MNIIFCFTLVSKLITRMKKYCYLLIFHLGKKFKMLYYLIFCYNIFFIILRVFAKEMPINGNNDQFILLAILFVLAITIVKCLISHSELYKYYTFINVQFIDSNNISFSTLSFKFCKANNNCIDFFYFKDFRK